MDSVAKKALDLQTEGTREFERAIAGPGPVMPRRQADPIEDADLSLALENTFPASDPIAATSAETISGAPPGHPPPER
ncbi:hypothetical protein [Phreatobacter stygius]|uniref:Uncharacterized protein n=1 Tax=Phreatobacter stygius TaxID=1940610 RepID=A0A4D7BFJ5_9HYPH|nr:hypothetical protein [Phreatobacter stygius]QCI66702.1 hypothetical protein E8M01_22165 [Phreatobacter stygius]